MVGRMVVIELALMGSMYPDRGCHTLIAAASVVALMGFWLLSG